MSIFGLASAGCGAPQSPPASAAPFSLATQAGGPAVVATDPASARRAAAAAARMAEVAPGGRRVEPASAAFLHGSPLGRSFLASPRPRAIARGEPAAACPGAGVAAAPRASGPADAAAGALSACLSQLEARGAADCGCRLLALDDALTAPLEDFAHAPGVGARLIGAAGLGGRPLVAIERPDSDPALVEVAFLDAAGPAAVAQLAEDGRARLLLLSEGGVYEGRREIRGWRRGRLMERLLLQGADGTRLIALIGFEPADIAADGLALGRWPDGAAG